MGRKRKLARASIGVGIGLGLIAVLGVLMNIAVGVLTVFMFIWNITDIQNVGPNFWNVTWLVIATGLGVGVVSGWVKSFQK